MVTARTRAPSPLAVGVVAAAVMAAAVVAIFVNMLPGGPSGLLPWNHTMTLRAVLPGADALQARAAVEIAGVQVGEVRELESRGSQAVVVMGIDPQHFDIHSGATAAIRPHGLLGSQFVELSPGPDSAPLLGDGATVAAAASPDPVDLDQILASLQAPEQQSLRTAIVELGDAAAGRGSDVNHLLAASDTLTRTLQAPVQALDSVAPNLSGSLVDAEAFNADFAQTPLDQLVRNSDATLQAFAANAAHLQSILTHADSALGVLDKALTGQGGNLHQTLQELPSLIPQLDQFTQQVGLVSRNLTGTDTTSSHPVDATQGIIDAIENPRSAFSSYDCTVQVPSGQSCPPQDRDYYLRVQVFNLLGLSTPPLPALPGQLCAALRAAAPAVASAAGCSAAVTATPASPGSSTTTIFSLSDLLRT